MPDYSFEYDFEFIHHTAIFSSEEKAILQDVNNCCKLSAF